MLQDGDIEGKSAHRTPLSICAPEDQKKELDILKACNRKMAMLNRKMEVRYD